MLDLAQVKSIQSNGMAIHGDDANIWVEFSMEAIRNNFESDKQGKEVFKTVAFITMMFPGDKTKTVKRPVNAEIDPHRFPRQWTAFQNQLEQVPEGLPLTEWPAIQKGEAMNLKAMKIHTVEQLAGLPDSALTWLGAREIRAKAKAFLERSGGVNSEMAQLQATNKRLEADLKATQEQLSELSKLVKKPNKKDE